MSKKGSLQGALEKVGGKTPAAAPAAIATETISGNSIPLSRQGKRALTGFYDPAVLKQFKLIAVERDTSMQGLLAEAVNDLFEKYGRGRIA